MEFTRRGLLYTLDSQLIAAVQYSEIGDTLLIRDPEKPRDELPEEAFLVTKDPLDTSKCFRISLKWDVYPEETGEESILTGQRRKHTSSTNDRGDVRVSVEIDILLESPALKKPIKASVKNISAGGVFFVCESTFTKGESVSFTLPLGGKDMSLTAQILNKVPTSKEKAWGYGCSLMDLDTATESRIRQFVFQEELRHRKNR